MDPISAIVGAVIAGASAALNETSSRAVKDAYAGLKKLLKDAYSFASDALLEKEPGNRAFKEAAEAELRLSSVAEDAAVLKQADALLEAVAAVPETELAAWGVDVKEIRAGRSVIFEKVSGSAGGVRADRIEADEDVRFSDVHGGRAGPKT